MYGNAYIPSSGGGGGGGRAVAGIVEVGVEVMGIVTSAALK